MSHGALLASVPGGDGAGRELPRRGHRLGGRERLDAPHRPAGQSRWTLVAPATLYAGTVGAGVFKSTDGEASWAALSGGLGAPPVVALAIDPVAPEILYDSTASGLYRSPDRGASFSLVDAGLVPPRIGSLALQPTRRTVLYAGGPGVWQLEQVAASFDGEGRADLAVVRPASGQ